MHDLTANVLRAEADLFAHGQAHPSDRKGIAERAQARARAVAEWVRAGSPDLPTGAPRACVTPRPVPGQRDDESKDWSLTDPLLLDVLRVGDGGGLLLTDGSREGWCPGTCVYDEDGARHKDPLEPGDNEALRVPMWVALRAGWV